MVLLFYCGIQSENRTKSWENWEGFITLPTPKYWRTYLTVYAGWAVTLSCRLMAFYEHPLLNEITYTITYACETCMHHYTNTPSDSNIYEYMPHSFKHTDATVHAATFLAKKQSSCHDL
jgi:hypothetical protein